MTTNQRPRAALIVLWALVLVEIAALPLTWATDPSHGSLALIITVTCMVVASLTTLFDQRRRREASNGRGRHSAPARPIDRRTTD
jgi:hypothetical protein